MYFQGWFHWNHAIKYLYLRTYGRKAALSASKVQSLTGS